MNFLKIFLTLLLSTQVVWADEAFLDPAYDDLVHPAQTQPVAFDSLRPDVFGNNVLNRSARRASNTEALIAMQSPVKSQGSRGTCSIFSAAAMLESMLIIKNGFDTDIDLSEEWLEYLVMRDRDSDGSNSYKNFTMIRRYGMPYEETLPYIGQTWKSVDHSGLSQERCGELEGRLLDSCLLGHFDQRLIDASDDQLLDNTSQFYDVEFYEARTEAAQNKADFIHITSNRFSIWSVDQIKRLLNQGIPLTMGIDFYYGAWNHRVGGDLGINRNMDHWAKGIVGYPERGSLDRQESPTKRAGHSVLIVGYDDNKVVEVETQMADGTVKKHTYKGVYYFKNSWGTSSFGVDFELNGKTYPGYGMITQKYANEMGGFYQMPLKKADILN